MPISFHDREQAFEAKFAHDEEFRFLTVARRDKLLARWAANRLSLTDHATGALVRDMLAIPDGPAHDQLLLQHVASLLSAAGAQVSEPDLAAALAACMRQALLQTTEPPPTTS
jgi:hypothetical protein